MLAREHAAGELLLDFAEERLEEPRAARVRAHLDAGCSQCAKELSFWRRSLAGLEAGGWPEVPDAVVQRAFDLFEELMPPPTTWARIVASLVFDSRLQPSLAGARGSAGGSFQLLFRTAGADVDLLCEPEQDGWQISGQALTAAPPQIRWRVRASSDSQEAETEANPLGEFRLRGLAPGVYQLALRDVGREIIVPDIHLQTM
jgi:hypothetical protein